MTTYEDVLCNIYVNVPLPIKIETLFFCEEYLFYILFEKYI